MKFKIELKLKSSSLGKLLHVLYQKLLMISSPPDTCQNQSPQQDLEYVTFISSPWNLFQVIFSSLF